MKTEKSTFAICFGNRAFSPESYVAIARKEVTEILTRLGYGLLMMDSELTHFGSVDNREDGKKYAKFLADNSGKFDGVILVMPNFSDECSTIIALRDAGVPIYIQAYPDKLIKWDSNIAMMHSAENSHYGCLLPEPAALYCIPASYYSSVSKEFEHQVDVFDRICRIVKGMKHMTVGEIGARTTAYKTVRYDELALEKHGITLESLDMAEVFQQGSQAGY